MVDRSKKNGSRVPKEKGAKKKGPRHTWARRRKKGEALILKTEESKYPEVLTTMRENQELKDLGVAVRNVRLLCTGEAILQLRRDTEKNGSAYKELAEKVLGDGVKVRALTTEVILRIKNLDEVTEEREVARALLEQHELAVATTAVRKAFHKRR